jgi:hypothetical protein
VNVDDDLDVFRRRIIHNCIDALHFGFVKLRTQPMLQSFPQHRQANDVHAFRGEIIDRGWLRIDVIHAMFAGLSCFAEFRAGNVHAGQLDRSLG